MVAACAGTLESQIHSRKLGIAAEPDVKILIPFAEVEAMLGLRELRSMRVRLPSREEIEKGRRAAQEITARLARQGWTIPLEMQPVDAWEIAETLTKREEIDAAFVDHFMRDERRNFKSMIKALIRSKELEPWRALVKDCAKGYRGGLFRLTIPALFPVIEGAVANLGGKGSVLKKCNALWKSSDP